MIKMQSLIFIGYPAKETHRFHMAMPGYMDTRSA